ncbi:MAG: dTMP kinase [Mycoplasmoidaceae bacterium]
MKSGLFITFEGPDGSGKTTILNKIMKDLEEFNINVYRTREPGGENKVCENIRDILLNNKDDVDKYAESLLFAASRAQHFNKFIVPQISKGINVICDRFIDSSIAYQGYGKNIDINWIKEINRFSNNKFEPDFTFFFDVKPNIAQKRIFVNPSREKNRFDLECLEFQEIVYNGYKEIIKQNPNKFIIINAEQSFDEVYKQVWNKMEKIFGIKND